MIEFTAEWYIQDVLSGRVAVCKWVRQAVERHVQDLEDGHERGLYFDADAARRVIAVFALLKQSKGEWAGRMIRSLIEAYLGWGWFEVMPGFS